MVQQLVGDFIDYSSIYEPEKRKTTRFFIILTIEGGNS